MAESREYYAQPSENGMVQISEEVVASIAAMAALEVDGVNDLSGSLGSEFVEMLGRKAVNKGIRVTSEAENTVNIDCDVIAKFAVPVFELGKNVQEAIRSSVESVTGLTVSKVNVNICGIALPREQKK